MEGINNENGINEIKAIVVLDAKQKKVFENIGINDNVDINFLKNGLSISQLDNSEVMINRAFLNASVIPQYINKVNQNFKVNIDVKTFKGILTTFSKNSNLIIKVSEQDIILSDKIKNVKIRLNEYTSKELNFKEPEYQTGIKLKYEDFKNLINDVNIISSYITFKFNKADNTLNVEGKGDTADYDTSIKLNSDAVIKNNEDATITLNVEFLKKSIKNIDKKSEIKLYFNNNSILKMIYTINNIDNICYIAPYIEN